MLLTHTEQFQGIELSTEDLRCPEPSSRTRGQTWRPCEVRVVATDGLRGSALPLEGAHCPQSPPRVARGPHRFHKLPDTRVPTWKPRAAHGCAAIPDGPRRARSTAWSTADGPPVLAFLGGDGERPRRTQEPRGGTRRSLAPECFRGKLLVNQSPPVRVPLHQRPNEPTARCPAVARR